MLIQISNTIKYPCLSLIIKKKHLSVRIHSGKYLLWKFTTERLLRIPCNPRLNRHLLRLIHALIKYVLFIWYLYHCLKWARQAIINMIARHYTCTSWWATLDETNHVFRELLFHPLTRWLIVCYNTIHDTCGCGFAFRHGIFMWKNVDFNQSKNKKNSTC